jgi:hypothetical protein
VFFNFILRRVENLVKCRFPSTRIAQTTAAGATGERSEMPDVMLYDK